MSVPRIPSRHMACASVVVAAQLLSLPLLPLLAQHPAPARDVVSVGRAAPFGMAVNGRVAQESATALAARVLAVLRTSPIVATPDGYHGAIKPVTGVSYPGFGVGMPYHAGTVAALTYFTRDAAGRATSEEGGRVVVRVIANLRRCDVGSDVHELDGGLPVIVQIVTGRFRDHAIYDGNCVVITAGSAPPVIPVTRERYLTLELMRRRAELAKHAADQPTGGFDAELATFLRERPNRMAEMQSTYVEMKKTNPEVAQQVLDASKQAEVAQEAALRDALKNGAQANYDRIVNDASAFEQHRIDSLAAQLASMSPAERARPAAVIPGNGDSTLVEVGTPDAVPLVSPNPSFFDRSVPPTVIQSVAVYIDGLQADTRPHEDSGDKDRARMEARLVDEMPWAQLEALVKR